MLPLTVPDSQALVVSRWMAIERDCCVHTEPLVGSARLQPVAMLEPVKDPAPCPIVQSCEHLRAVGMAVISAPAANEPVDGTDDLHIITMRSSRTGERPYLLLIAFDRFSARPEIHIRFPLPRRVLEVLGGRITY